LYYEIFIHFFNIILKFRSSSDACYVSEFCQLRIVELSSSAVDADSLPCRDYWRSGTYYANIIHSNCDLVAHLI